MNNDLHMHKQYYLCYFKEVKDMAKNMAEVRDILVDVTSFMSV